MSTSEAKIEIAKTLKLTTFCTRQFGLTFGPPKNTYTYVRDKSMLIISFACILYHIFSEIVFIFITLANSPRVEDVVPLFHTFGYGALSIVKLFGIWSKRDIFVRLLRELEDIWPIPPLEDDEIKIKNDSLKALRFIHIWFFMINAGGVWFYNLQPIIIFLYQKWNGLDSQIGFVWCSWYPYDKHSTAGHIFTYFFEMFAGTTCVWAMMGADLLFTAMASHICMLLRFLHMKLLALPTPGTNSEQQYEEIVNCITLHQRLILYINELEQAFAFVNLVNVVFSSLNICCVVFVIVLLEPLFVLSSKLFLISSLIQIGFICWYSDNIYAANEDVGVSAFNSKWYETSPKCRKALLFLIKRSQKPIGFTAMHFTDIKLTTYSSILTRSYSYFALLYTLYSDSDN